MAIIIQSCILEKADLYGAKVTGSHLSSPFTLLNGKQMIRCREIVEFYISRPSWAINYSFQPTFILFRTRVTPQSRALGRTWHAGALSYSGGDVTRWLSGRPSSGKDKVPLWEVTTREGLRSAHGWSPGNLQVESHQKRITVVCPRA